ncbi:hypothetical protein ES332_D10G076600v1 [Gossypium tomentosum]|uniref:Uncharacterized protein n=1 Tax=Gossypium tomentosum TaxID=34277 RepID=A0A5D2J1K2_GOSTO|nr:hypothetical protein ES332_D10G076600v1 [Gossypium tomentosum]
MQGPLSSAHWSAFRDRGPETGKRMEKPLPFSKPASSDGEGPMTTSDSGADSGVKRVDTRSRRLASSGGGQEACGEAERRTWAVGAARVSVIFLIWARVYFCLFWVFRPRSKLTCYREYLCY